MADKLKTKHKKQYIFTGFGFPVELLDVPMKLFQKEWILDINLNKLEHNILMKLITKPFRLTGNEINFIRYNFGLTVGEFSDRFYSTPTKVQKWIDTKDSFSLVDWSTEKDIRLEIAYRHIENCPELFLTLYHELEKPKPVEGFKQFSISYSSENSLSSI